MITIYANWTGTALATGATIEEAYSSLTAGHCTPHTKFGDGPADLTALDTGPHDVRPTPDKFDLLHVAREFCPAVVAPAALRVEG